MQAVRFLFQVAFLVASFSAAFAACAQYPDRPIKLVVPQAAGSNTDIVARTLAAELSAQLGQSVVVDNRPGGALMLGLEITAKSPPDGYTLCMSPIGALAISPNLVAKVPFDIERDLQPVALITQGPMMLVVSPSVPVTGVKDLIEYAKKNPGRISIASSTNGSPGHLAGELFKQMSGTDIEHIPYKGGAQAITDLVAGRVQVMIEGMNSIGPQVKAGKLKALAVTTATRNAAFPDVPTLLEAGLFEITTWQGMVAPAGVPRPILERISAAVNRAIATPAFQARMAEIGNEGGGGSVEQFTAFSRAERAKWGEVIRRAGIKME
jgi:tripartite-type tricarboxylate transporter receptor subunit TctC